MSNESSVAGNKNMVKLLLCLSPVCWTWWGGERESDFIVGSYRDHAGQNRRLAKEARNEAAKGAGV